MFINDGNVCYELVKIDNFYQLKMYYRHDIVLTQTLTPLGLKTFWKGQKRKVEKRCAESQSRYTRKRCAYVKINGL